MSDALLIYTLLKDYHAITPDLKALRANEWANPVEDWEYEAEQKRAEATREAARSRATGWFNQVAILYLHGLIDEKTLRIVAQPRAAQLWVEHVADLDKTIRVERGAKADAVPTVERFWRDYAAGNVWKQTVMALPGMAL